jgi:hypothetical protein
MGTNFYSILKVEDLEKKRQKLIEQIQTMDISNAGLCEDDFRIHEDGWDRLSPWDEFINGNSIHLGKRSMGWKFCWNFNDNKYYSNKEELLEFIRSRRVVDEYGDEIHPDEFIQMALEWGQDDGMVADEEYMRKHQSWMSNPSEYADKEIDGLRVSSSTEFS